MPSLKSHTQIFKYLSVGHASLPDSPVFIPIAISSGKELFDPFEIKYSKLFLVVSFHMIPFVPYPLGSMQAGLNSIP